MKEAVVRPGAETSKDSDVGFSDFMPGWVGKFTAYSNVPSGKALSGSAVPTTNPDGRPVMVIAGLPSRSNARAW
jgi:hypothetical protein